LFARTSQLDARVAGVTSCFVGNGSSTVQSERTLQGGPKLTKTQAEGDGLAKDRGSPSFSFRLFMLAFCFPVDALLTSHYFIFFARHRLRFLWRLVERPTELLWCYYVSPSRIIYFTSRPPVAVPELARSLNASFPPG
jgi:hypothetical protein